MEDLLSGALLVLLVGGAVFAWADWRVRARKLPEMVGPSWDCPHCGVKNEAELGVCWSCGAGIGRYALARVRGSAWETWRCRHGRAWTSTSRGWGGWCASAPGKQRNGGRCSRKL